MRYRGEEANSLLEESWVANAAAWTDAVRQGRIPSRRAGTDLAIVKALEALPRGRLLDLGCGEGWLTRQAELLGHQATGIDSSAPLIHEAQRTGGAHFHCLSYRQFAEGALPKISFEIVVANFSLLSEDLVPVLAAVRESLSPGGTFLIQTLHPLSVPAGVPYRSEWRVENFQDMGPEFAAPMPYFFRTLGRWVEDLSAAGFTVAKADEPLHPETGRPLSLLMTAR